jgi:hypothetical protein
VDIVDRDTRKVLGTLPRSAASNGKLLLGGRKLKTSQSASPSKIVVTDTHQSADLKMPAALPPRAPLPLVRDFARFIGLDPDIMPTVSLEDGTFALFHFLGSIRGMLFDMVLRDIVMVKIQGSTPLCTVVIGAKPEIPADLGEEQIRELIVKNQKRLTAGIPTGPWFKNLTPSWQRDHLIERLDPKRFVKALRNFGREDVSISPNKERILRNLVTIRW